MAPSCKVLGVKTPGLIVSSGADAVPISLGLARRHLREDCSSQSTLEQRGVASTATDSTQAESHRRVKHSIPSCVLVITAVHIPPTQPPISGRLGLRVTFPDGPNLKNLIAALTSERIELIHLIRKNAGLGDPARPNKSYVHSPHFNSPITQQ
jgi:hypothetical protein